MISPSVGFVKLHTEIIPKLKEEINNSQHLTI